MIHLRRQIIEALARRPNPRTHSQIRRSAQATGTHATNSKEYPPAPAVGIGVVILRRKRDVEEVLLIRRGKEPQKGMLTFPGGFLELGETMVACAIRETLEETGLRLRNRAQGEMGSRCLESPRPVDAVDAIHRDADGRIQFHYTIVDVAAVLEDGNAEPVAGDDAAEVLWTPVRALRSLQGLGEHCARIAEEAVDRFEISD